MTLIKLFFLVFCLLPSAINLTAQDTLSFHKVQQAPRLNKADVPGFRGKANTENLFLTAVYSTVNYPEYARKKRVGATIEVRYLIDTVGAVYIEASRVLTDEEIEQIPAETSLLLVTVYSTHGFVSDNLNLLPRTVEAEKRLAKAYEALESEAAEVISKLPKFAPGQQDGEKVVVRDTRYFVFKLE